MDIAKEKSLEHLQPFLESLRKDIMPNVPTDDVKLTKMFVDVENKIYNIVKKIHDEATLMKVEAESEKTGKKAVAPKGWEKTVKEMKKNKDIDNPWALAWSMKNKGYKPHSSKLLTKNALDAVNEELNKPTYEPRKDFDRQDSPFYSKGIEENKVAPDPKRSSIKTKRSAFEQMPKKFEGSLRELCEVAIKNGYARATGTPSRINFKKRIEDQNYDYDIEYKKKDGVWEMQGGEVRVKYEFGPDIETFMRKLPKGKEAEIKQHKAPTKLPPREDVRTHMDQEVKKEKENDPDLKKEAKRRLPLYFGRK